MEVSQINRNRRSSNDKLLAKFRRRAQRLKLRTQQLAARLEAIRQQYKQANEELHAQTQQVAALQAQIQLSGQQQARLLPPPFRDPNVFQHQFAASMIALCVNLSRIMPLRTVPKTLQIIMPALGIQTHGPDRETITRWCKRLGLDRLMQNQTSTEIKRHKDMIWIVDHSNQIGTQKVLAIEPGQSWTRDDVRRVYKELARKSVVRAGCCAMVQWSFVRVLTCCVTSITRRMCCGTLSI
jgi:hypothetical protein